MFARAVPRKRRNLVNLGIRRGVFVLSILADGDSLRDGFPVRGASSEERDEIASSGTKLVGPAAERIVRNGFW